MGKGAAGERGGKMNGKRDNDMTARHTPGPSGSQSIWRAQGTSTRHRAAGAQQSRRLSERLGACIRRNSTFRDESARDLSQLLAALVAALAAMIIVGRFFLGAN